MGMRVWDCGESERWPPDSDFTGADSVMERIGVQTLPYCENRPTSTRSSLAKKD